MTLDIIHRVLKRVFNFNIVLMMGITDIDDKIIQRSQKVVPEFKFIPEGSSSLSLGKCALSRNIEKIRTRVHGRYAQTQCTAADDLCPCL